jgi:hypothetical protein
MTVDGVGITAVLSHSHSPQSAQLLPHLPALQSSYMGPAPGVPTEGYNMMSAYAGGDDAGLEHQVGPIGPSILVTNTHTQDCREDQGLESDVVEQRYASVSMATSLL